MVTLRTSELRAGWWEHALRRRQCYPFQNWRVPEESGHPSKEETGQVTCGLNFSLLNFPINVFASAWITLVSQCVCAVLTTLNNSLLLCSESVCAPKLWFALCVWGDVCMLSGVSAFLSCEYRVLSWRYCTVWICRDVCTQLQVCNLFLVWLLMTVRLSMVILFATVVVPKGAQCHKELYRHRSSCTLICVSIVNIWAIFYILQFPLSCICHSASLFKLL